MSMCIVPDFLTEGILRMVCEYSSSSTNMISCGGVFVNYSNLKEKLKNVLWCIDHNDIALETGLLNWLCWRCEVLSSF
jgi:hypothetical protein